MNLGAGFILIIIGLLLLFTVVTGKFAILENAFLQLFDLTPETTGTQTPGTTKTLPDITQPIIPGNITLPEIFIPDYRK